MIKNDMVNTLNDTTAWGFPNLKLIDVLPLKCFIFGDNANRIPTKKMGKNIPSINEYGCRLDTSFVFLFVRRSKFKPIIAALIREA